MFECKCFRNLVGFAVSRPPCVIFTVCLATFAVGLFSLGYYVQTHEILSKQTSKAKEWPSFINHFNAKHFCVAENETISAVNQSNSANSSALVHLIIPVVLTLYPSKAFHGAHRNISHVTTVVQPHELGLKGLPEFQLLNITLSLFGLWSLDCQYGKKCDEAAAFETCGSLLLPAKVVPGDMPRYVCNATTSVKNIAFMQSASEPSKGKEACPGGVTVRTTIPRPMNPSLNEDNPISLVDSSTVNLRLQYSGYFLFVLVISSILYGMIKGKPVKQMQKKTAADLLRQF